MTALLFYSVKPESLVILSFVIGIVTGICVVFLILSLRNIIRDKKAQKSQSQS
jgi:uncharacterized membrane protein YgaE (UPF0421/DUF939 family)